MWERVQALRLARNIPISKVEKDVGFSNGSLKKISGKTECWRIKALADYFNVSMEYLMTGEEPSPAAGYNITPFEFEVVQVLRKSEHRNSILALLNLTDPNVQKKEKEMSMIS